ncbi:MAG: F0F1 ATP synthase subunit epsilon [Pikeienuella sp.]
MADKMSFELVSPERKLATGEAEMIVLPGMEGDVGIMPGHAPFLTTLRPGLVTVSDGSSKTEYFVTGGFAEVSPEATAILAEEAVERESLDRAFIDARIEAAKKAHENATEETREAAHKRYSDLHVIAEQLL